MQWNQRLYDYQIRPNIHFWSTRFVYLIFSYIKSFGYLKKYYSLQRLQLIMLLCINLIIVLKKFKAEGVCQLDNSLYYINARCEWVANLNLYYIRYLQPIMIHKSMLPSAIMRRSGCGKKILIVIVFRFLYYDYLNNENGY